MSILLTTVAIAFLASLLCTPAVCRLASRLRIVDTPDGHRKLHGRVIPLGGGVVVLAGFALAVGLALLVPNAWSAELIRDGRFLAGFFLSAVVLCGVGLIDDRFVLRGRQKLAGQVVAAGIVIAAGLVIERVQILGFRIELGLLSVPVTLLWLLGAINALNLLDGVDGLAASIGMVLSGSLAAMALMTGHTADAILAVAMAGSLAGFLVYNFPPARIFLGDAGSMLIGLVLGALAIRSSLKGPATVAVAAPLAIWAIPFFDVGMAVLRRKLTGRSIYTPDHGHLHHCLQRRGYKGGKMLAVCCVLCGVTAAGALAGVYRQNELLAFGNVAAVICTLVVSRFFGHSECVLLGRRIKAFVVSLVPFHRPADNRSRQLATRFQGTLQWERLWQTLMEFADCYDMSAVQLNVTLPAMHEEYHAHWERKGAPDVAEYWHSNVPLVAGGVTVGRLKMTGAATDASASTRMYELIAGLKPFEQELQSLLEERPFESPRPAREAGPVRHEAASPARAAV